MTTMMMINRTSRTRILGQCSNLGAAIGNSTCIRWKHSVTGGGGVIQRNSLDEHQSSTDNTHLDHCHQMPLRRGFSTETGDDDDNDGWIQPSRPLMGDQGNRHGAMVDQQQQLEHKDLDKESLEQELNRMLKEEEEQAKTSVKTIAAPKQPPSPPSVDWMKTRRSTLLSTPGSYLNNAQEKGLDEDAAVTTLIPIVKHQLLSKSQIATVLEASGGMKVMTVMDDFENPRFGGAYGYMIVTAPSNRHMVELADELVRQLRYRKLQQVGVLSAIDGPQGNRSDPLEHWMVVDCQNFVVNILLEDTRRHLNLEDLWTGKDPIWTIDSADEEAWDAYVQAYPAPEGYGAPANSWDAALRKLEKNRYTAHHRSMEPKKGKAKKKQGRKLQRGRR